MGIKINTEKRQEGIYVISLVGTLDSVTYKECEEKLAPILEQSTKAVIFDMERLDYISSIGFSVLLGAKEAIGAKGGTLAVTNLKPEVERVFRVMRVMPETLFANMNNVDEHISKFLAGKK